MSPNNPNNNHHRRRACQPEARHIGFVVLFVCVFGLFNPLLLDNSSSNADIIPMMDYQQLPYYPLDKDDISKYYNNPKAGTKFDTGARGERWIPKNDQFYDCPDSVMGSYTPSSLAKSSPYYESQEGEDKYMYQHFFYDYAAKNRPHYFIELGALDGKTLSNSYFFDYGLGWHGVLIEGETRNYLGLEQNRGQGERAQHVVVAHLAVCKEYQFIHMSGSGPEAGVASAGGKGLTTVPCFPMHQILSMASVPYTDFYSIDVEGAELDVITTHNFHSVPVHTLLIEMRPADEDTKNQTGNALVRRALYARGFCRYSNIVGHNNEVWVNVTWSEEAIAAKASSWFQ